jgi:hypothetical protein
MSTVTETISLYIQKCFLKARPAEKQKVGRGWSAIKQDYATITRTTSCATAALSVLLWKPARTLYGNQSTLNYDALCVYNVPVCTKFK